MGKSINNTYLLKCGKCNIGTLEFRNKITDKYIETFVGKCSNKKCKYQYGIKEICDSKLKQL